MMVMSLVRLSLILTVSFIPFSQGIKCYVCEARDKKVGASCLKPDASLLKECPPGGGIDYNSPSGRASGIDDPGPSGPPTVRPPGKPGNPGVPGPGPDGKPRCGWRILKYVGVGEFTQRWCPHFSSEEPPAGCKDEDHEATSEFPAAKGTECVCYEDGCNKSHTFSASLAPLLLPLILLLLELCRSNTL